jgi:hypothetical protein
MTAASSNGVDTILERGAALADQWRPTDALSSTSHHQSCGSLQMLQPRFINLIIVARISLDVLESGEFLDLTRAGSWRCHRYNRDLTWGALGDKAK